MWFNRLIHYIAVLAMVGAICCPALVQANNAKQINATNQEVIDEVGRFTGLPSDTLQAIRNESPELLNNLNDTVTAIKVVDLFYQARDTEALTEIYKWEKGKVIDFVADKLLPQNMLTFIAAVKAYKAALEIINDYVFIPSMEETIYDRYKSARGGSLDYRYASPNEAYDGATAGGSYFPAKKKMYNELVKSRGYNPEHIGDKLEAKLWKEIDSFWMNRMEAKYQHEMMKKNKEMLVNQIWNKSKADVERLKKAAAKLNQPANDSTAAKKDSDTKQRKHEGKLSRAERKANKEAFKQAKQDKSSNSTESNEEGNSLNLSYKPKSSSAGVVSGQKVGSCKACYDGGLACVCGNSSCCCSDPKGWCDPN